MALKHLVGCILAAALAHPIGAHAQSGRGSPYTFHGQSRAIAGNPGPSLILPASYRPMQRGVGFGASLQAHPAREPRESGPIGFGHTARPALTTAQLRARIAAHGEVTLARQGLERAASATGAATAHLAALVREQPSTPGELRAQTAAVRRADRRVQRSHLGLAQAQQQLGEAGVALNQRFVAEQQAHRGPLGFGSSAPRDDSAGPPVARQPAAVRPGPLGFGTPERTPVGPRELEARRLAVFTARANHVAAERAAHEAHATTELAQADRNGRALDAPSTPAGLVHGARAIRAADQRVARARTLEQHLGRAAAQSRVELAQRISELDAPGSRVVRAQPLGFAGSSR